MSPRRQPCHLVSRTADRPAQATDHWQRIEPSGGQVQQSDHTVPPPQKQMRSSTTGGIAVID